MTKKQTRKAKRAAKKPYRIQHRFWLDITRDDEFSLDEQLAQAKKKRSFASTLRNALRLWFDLIAGNVDVLCELFPWIEAKIAGRAGGNNTELIEEFRRLLIEQGGHNIPTGPSNYPQHKPAANAGPRPLNVPKLAPVVIDDDDQDTIVLKCSTSTDASVNLLNSMLSLQ